MTEDRNKPVWPLWTAVALFLVLVVYPLSTGPVIRITLWLAQNHWIDWETKTSISGWLYLPLSFLCAWSPAAHHFFNVYLDWWGVS